MSIFKVFVDNYNNVLKTHSLAVNACTGFIIAATGDIICQKLMPIPNVESKSTKLLSSSSLSSSSSSQNIDKDNKIIKQNIDKVNKNVYKSDKNILVKNSYCSQDIKIDWKRTMDMGLIRALVITPFIQKWYPFVRLISPGSKFINILGRITVDQLIGSPIVILLVFTARTILSNQSVDYVINQIKHQLLPTWKAGLMYWPFIHSITFGIMPLKHQALWAHFASLYWNAVLSYYSSLKPVK